MAAKKKSKQGNTDSPKRPTVATQKLSGSTLIFEKGFWGQHWLTATILFLAAFVLYASSINFEYVLDDKIVFTENDYVKKGMGGLKEIFTTESFSGYFGGQRDLVVGGRYRPLSIATFAVEHAFFGPNAKISHFINILLYALTGLLLFRLLHILPSLSDKQTTWFLAFPFIASLLFLCHPVHVEAVANVKGRDEILSLMGALASLFYAFKYQKSNQFIWLLPMGLLFFLALLAKESALTFIAIVPLSLYFFDRANWKTIGISAGVLLAIGLAYLSIRTGVIGYFLDSGKEVRDIMNNPFYGLDASEKFATIFYTLGLYIKLLFVPHPLTHDYYPYHIPVMSWGDWQSLLSLVVHIALGIVALLGLKKKWLVSYGILFYFITLSIVSNIPFTVGTFMNERFIYMSSVGFCLIAAWFISSKIPQWVQDEKETFNYLSIGLAVIAIVGYSAKTLSRVPAWETPMTLNQAAIKVSKNSARANLFMGTALFNRFLAENDPQVKKDLIGQCDEYIKTAIKINPRYGSAIKMYSGVVAEKYKLDNDLDELLRQFRILILAKPDIQYIDTYIDYLLSRADRQKLAEWSFKVGSDFAERGSNYYPFAIKYLEKYGLQLSPNDQRIRQRLGQIYQQMGNSQKARLYLGQ